MAKEEEMAELKANLRAKSHVVRAVQAISEHHLAKAADRIEELEAKLAIVERVSTIFSKICLITHTINFVA